MNRWPRLSLTSLLCCTVACQPSDEAGFGVGGSGGVGGGGGAPSTNCPAGMVEVDAVAAATLGETDPDQLDAHVGNIIPAVTVSVEAFCVAIHPLPGVSGAAWMQDGLNIGQVEILDGLLPDFGRRLCTVSELMVAAAGTDNQRYAYGPDYDAAACGTEAFFPSALGSNPGCTSPSGARDFHIRSSWAVLDDAIHDAVEPSRGDAGIPGDGEYAAYGGTAQQDTFYAPDNFGIHFYGPEDFSSDIPAYPTDDVRICGAVGDLDGAVEAEWSDWVGALRDAATYRDVLGPGLELNR